MVYKETCQDIMNEISSLTNNHAKFNVQSDLIKVTNKDCEMFRLTQSYLNDKGINYYSIPPEGQGRFKYVIRNLPDDFVAYTLKNELKNTV